VSVAATSDATLAAEMMAAVRAAPTIHQRSRSVVTLVAVLIAIVLQSNRDTSRARRARHVQDPRFPRDFVNAIIGATEAR
jgi:hypothetical protein